MENTLLFKKCRAFFAIMICLSVVAFMLGACDQQENKNELKMSIEKANQTWMDAVQKGDAAAVAAMYTDDGFILPPNVSAIQGREGVEGFFSAAMNAGIRKVRLITEEVEGTDESAIEKGTYEMMVDGDQVVDQGKYLVHWKNVDGKWMFHKDMFNTNMPAAPASMASLKKGNLIGVHVVSAKLKPGVSMKQFVEFYNTRIIPESRKHFPEATIYLTKGVRGENPNGIGLIYHFESENARDKFFKNDGSATEAGNVILAKMKPTFDQLSQEYGTTTTSYTDWLIE